MVKALIGAGQWPGRRPSVPGETLPAVWSTQWTARPDAPVLFDGGSAEPVTAAALHARTGTLAGALAGWGVGPGDRVLWCARATAGSIAALLAVIRCGAVLVPLSTSSTSAEMEHVVRDARPVLAIFDRERTRGSAEGPRVVHVDQLEEAGAGATAAGIAEPRPEDDALIVYTSGTTGKPKGAVHTHASLLAGVAALQTAWEWTPDDRLLLCLPLFHVHGLCAGLFGTLAAGGAAVVFDRFEEEAIMRAVPPRPCSSGSPPCITASP